MVFPNSDVSQGFALSDCPRWMVIDRNDTMQIGRKLRAVALDQKTDLPLLTATAVEQLTRALAGRGLPQRDVVARALENDDAADILTDRQAVILDAIRLLNRVEVRGGAGSGKTFMATERARRLAAAGRRNRWSATPTAWPPPQAHHRHLEAAPAARLRRGVPHPASSGAHRGTDESERTTETSQFFEHDLPAQMEYLAASLPDGHRFDAIVVDEAVTSPTVGGSRY